MTKTLNEIQEENRKSIIMANNPEAKTYDEALELELGYRCRVIVTTLKENRTPTFSKFDDTVLYNSLEKNEYELLGGESVKRKDIASIIGTPLTLNRVLIALSQTKKGEVMIMNISGKFYTNLLVPNIDIVDAVSEEPLLWDLTKETLEEQTEETQRAINKLLTNEKVKNGK
jgi:hypothetical protein